MLFNKQKKLGQVFLKDQAIIKKIIQAGKIKEKDQILEIGPGKGVLTQELLKTNAEIIAVEKDEELVKFLENLFRGEQNLKIIHADIRDFLISNSKFQILHSNYKVIGNIPYYLTSHLIQILLEQQNQPKDIILMIQKEVAQRIISQPPQMNLLAVSVQFYAKPEIICHVSKTAFTPIPKVDSAIIKLTPYPAVAKSNTARQSFFKIVKSGFKQPRKLLLNNLSVNLKIEKEIIKKAFKQLNIPLQTRAQNLSIKQWISLSLLLIKNNV
ncbi:MAG TPA: 16S rRNA (adenine(1518)-N(6)/adenine(1519)-N(6))-dimethyltransferase RsmA [Candidatus Paceibacterota bacterium]|nr:16S rRNA (adenine(1518)-N(6)/adenine(1519)-N(6))-dimethyltransferase RsmA [Candidatus Paceibacterota bacterium]